MRYVVKKAPGNSVNYLCEEKHFIGEVFFFTSKLIN